MVVAPSTDSKEKMDDLIRQKNPTCDEPEGAVFLEGVVYIESCRSRFGTFRFA
jgi:hypothetical protein